MWPKKEKKQDGEEIHPRRTETHSQGHAKNNRYRNTLVGSGRVLESHGLMTRLPAILLSYSDQKKGSFFKKNERLDIGWKQSIEKLLFSIFKC